MRSRTRKGEWNDEKKKMAGVSAAYSVCGCDGGSVSMDDLDFL